MATDPLTGEVQKCFTTADGFRLCNFIFRKGEVRWTKSGKWWRWKILRRLSKKKILREEDILSKPTT